MLGILKKTSFQLAVNNFCWTAVQNLSKPTILDKKQSMKDNSKTKNEQYCAVRLFKFKVAETFVDFLSAIVVIFYRDVCIEVPAPIDRKT